MNTNSNTYTIIYSAIMVIVVAAALAFAASALKVPQEKNIEIEKKMNILMSVGKAADASQANDKNAFIEGEYSKYIVEQFLINVRGERVEGNAFTTDVKAELQKNADDRKLPVFVCNDNGSKLYILPVRGAGLWGAIWGYVSLESDFNTVYGAIFDHAGETPGLGAEIATPQFQSKFKGKRIFDGNRFVGVEVVKAGLPVNEHSVDGISGGTITSVAVGNMLLNCLGNYQAYFEKQKTAQKPVITEEIPATDSIMADSTMAVNVEQQVESSNPVL